MSAAPAANGQQHRLNTDAHKWQPLGIGAAGGESHDGNGQKVAELAPPAKGPAIDGDGAK